jgi:hypothetical protein
MCVCVRVCMCLRVEWRGIGLRRKGGALRVSMSVREARIRVCTSEWVLKFVMHACVYVRVCLQAQFVGNDETKKYGQL